MKHNLDRFQETRPAVRDYSSAALELFRLRWLGRRVPRGRPERITTDDHLAGCTRAALEETTDRVTFVIPIRFKTR